MPVLAMLLFLLSQGRGSSEGGKHALLSLITLTPLASSFCLSPDDFFFLVQLLPEAEATKEPYL